MKKLLIICASILVLTLSACSGGKDDPNQGKYHIDQVSVFGMWTPFSEFYGEDVGEVFVELNSGNKGKINFEGSADLKWKLNGENVEIEIDGTTYKGTLKDGVLLIENFMVEGANFTFVKEGVTPPVFE